MNQQRLFRPPRPTLPPATVRRLKQMFDGADLADVKCKITFAVERTPEAGKPEKYTATVEVSGDFLEGLLFPGENAPLPNGHGPYTTLLPNN